MSKVVRGVGKAIGGIVKGVGKAISGIAKGVGKIFKSKLGKAILIGAAVYFGGAALMGGFGASAAGGSFLSGAGAGLSSAASGISGAWTALTSGSLSGAGSSLASGFTGASAAGAGTVAAAVPTAAAIAPSAANAAFLEANMGAMAPVGSGLSNSAIAAGANTGLTGLNAAPTAAGGGNGLINGVRGWWGGLDRTEKLLAANTGAQLGGTALQMYGANKAAEEQEQLNEQQKRDYNTNVGTRLYPATTYPVAPQPIVTRRY